MLLFILLENKVNRFNECKLSRTVCEFCLQDLLQTNSKCYVNNLL